MDLPAPIIDALRPLLEAVPLSTAMPELVVTARPSSDAIGHVESVLRNLPGEESGLLAAGLWLYIDDLERSHAVSQTLDTPAGAFWHGIMHRREGDSSNSHYWFRRAGRHPAMDAIQDYEPHGFIDAVATQSAKSPADLVVLQRREWRALFEWCARNG